MFQPEIDDADFTRIIDLALAALNHPQTLLRNGPASATKAQAELLRLRDQFNPPTPDAFRLKLLHELEDYVRREDMIWDELWDDQSTIIEIYELAIKKLGRVPISLDELVDADAVSEAIYDLGIY